MKHKIQDNTLGYAALKHLFVTGAVRRSYRRFQVEGLENIPTQGAAIWSPNHTNALMDALVVLSATPRAKVFLARADVFKKPLVRKILTFCKILPIFRIRDGVEAVRQNDEIIACCVDVLHDEVPLCIYPEATHRPKHSLLKLSKGIFHIAFQTMEKFPAQPVHIVPVGIEYSDFFRFHSQVLVRFGKPINVSEFVAQHTELTVPQQMQELKKMLTEHMAGLISYVPDDIDYDAVWEYTKLHTDNRKYFRKTIAAIQQRDGVRYRGLMRRLKVNQETIKQVLAFRQAQPESARQMLLDIDARRSWRIQNGVSVYSIARNPGLLEVLLKSALCLLGLPYYLLMLVAYCLVWIPTLKILAGTADDAFFNTVRFAVRSLVSWIVLLVGAIVMFARLPFVCALSGSLLLMAGYAYLLDYREFARKTLSDCRWLYKRRKAPQVQCPEHGA